MKPLTAPPSGDPPPVASLAPRRRRATRLATVLAHNPKAALGLGLFLAYVLVAVLAPVLAPYSPQATGFPPLSPPGPQHWLGTTGAGQDVLSQLLVGSRISLGVGLAAGVIITLLAIVLGMLPAYLGGWVDTVFGTLTNVMLVIPGLPLLIVVAAYIHQSGTLTLAIILGLTGWAWGARVLRSQTLTFRQRDFVVAARLAGASHWRVLWGEILPNMLSLVVANFMFGTLGAVLAAASLQFLGLADPDVISWGTMLYWAQVDQALLNGAWWWLVAPGLAIAGLGASLALMNYGVDELTNPRLAVRRPAPARKEEEQP